MPKLSDPILIVKVGQEGYVQSLDQNLKDIFSRLIAEEKKAKKGFQLFGYHKAPNRDYFLSYLTHKKSIDVLFIPNKTDQIMNEGWNSEEFKNYKTNKTRDQRSWNRMEEIDGKTKIPKEFNIWGASTKKNYFGLVIKDLEIHNQGKFKLNLLNYKHIKTKKTVKEYHGQNPTLIVKKNKRAKRKLEVDVLASAKLIYPYTAQLFKK